MKWKDGDPDGYMLNGGSATQIQGSIVFRGTWSCTIRVGDGQFTVPGFVTAGLPQAVQDISATSNGTINLTPIIAQIVNVPGVHLTSYFSTWSTGKSVLYIYAQLRADVFFHTRHTQISVPNAMKFHLHPARRIPKVV